MENKLRGLIGKANIWLYVKSSNGWLKDVEILEVESDLITFRYQHESAAEVKVWEKTTRIDNILEVDVRLVTVPKCEQKIQNMRDKLTKLLEQE